MMDGRAITEHKLIIKIIDENECAKYDPIGLCYVDDCMSCPNARVKIIREDGIKFADAIDVIDTMHTYTESDEEMPKLEENQEGKII